MAIKIEKADLKNYFNTGDKPSQAQYADLIDSQLNLAETGTQIALGTISSSFLGVQNHITSSGNISSSGTLIVNEITASGNISSSGFHAIQGDITTTGDARNQMVVIERTDSSNDYRWELLGGSSGDVEEFQIINDKGGGNVTALKIHNDGLLEIPGNISSSYTSTGSFGSAMLTNLPTTEPLVSGALWLSGSGGGSSSGSKYLMVFNG